MPRVDLIDISHYQTVTDWALLEGVPIFHKVNEGRAIDTAVRDRLPRLADRPVFGGYTVLMPEGDGRSSIREQVEIYADVIGPYWRAGAGTQLDVEAWWTAAGYRYGRPVNADEVDEANAVHVELLGRPAFTYLNRNEKGMLAVFNTWRRRNPAAPYWMPGYSAGISAAAAQLLAADVWQFSSSGTVAGISGRCDVNELLNPAALELVCGVTTQHEEETAMPVLWNPKGYANVFLIGAGNPVALSPAAFAYYRDTRGVAYLEADDHEWMLESVLAGAGLTRTALVPA